MSTLVDTVSSVHCVNGHVSITLAGGRTIHFVATDNPRLRGANDQQLNQIELSPFGVHWPALEEDLSTRGLLAGDFGQHQKPTRQSSQASSL